MSYSGGPHSYDPDSHVWGRSCTLCGEGPGHLLHQRAAVMVHLAGPVEPCPAWLAPGMGHRHSHDPAEVTCAACLGRAPRGTPLPAGGLPVYVHLGGLAHRHGISGPAWREHDHLGGGAPHAHDPETGLQVPPGGGLWPHERDGG